MSGRRDRPSKPARVAVPSPALAEDAGEAAVQRRPWRARLARAWFWSAIVLLAFGWGMWSGWSRSFPFDLARRAVKTAGQLVGPDPRWARRWAPDPASLDRLEAGRLRFAGSEGDRGLGGVVLAAGGPGRFREFCPGAGACLAVQFSPSGEVAGAWPFDPAVLMAAPGRDLGVEKAPGVDSEDELEVFAVAPYGNGDLAATFHYAHGHFPEYAGMARIDGASGDVLWYQRDYSHHEPLVGAGDTTWVAGLTLVEGGSSSAPPFLDLPCDGTIRADMIRVVDGGGRLLDEAPLLEIVADSPWGLVLQDPPEPCDPLHLNSISAVRDDVSGLAGVEPGDLVLSLRNLSAFAIVGRQTYNVKRWVRGTFHRQHRVLHLGGSEFVMFDNRSSRETRLRGASRVLVVDVATGEERVVFPKNGGGGDGTPA